MNIDIDFDNARLPDVILDTYTGRVRARTLFLSKQDYVSDSVGMQNEFRRMLASRVWKNPYNVPFRDRQTMDTILDPLADLAFSVACPASAVWQKNKPCR